MFSSLYLCNMLQVQSLDTQNDHFLRVLEEKTGDQEKTQVRKITPGGLKKLNEACDFKGSASCDPEYYRCAKPKVDNEVKQKIMDKFGAVCKNIYDCGKTKDLAG